MLKEELIKQSQILLVDDEPANLLFLQRVFEWEGYKRVTGVNDPVKALEICRFAPPDIVLLDLHMPQLDGYTVLERLRSLSHSEDFIPILIFTADVNPESRKRALGLGATDFLTKPGDATEIALRVHNFLRMRHLHRAVLLQNEYLECRVKERTSELEASRLDALERLAKAAECRDDDTGLHIHRVGDLAALIAEALPGLLIDPNHLRLAAPLHDVGKIGIPDGILLKPGKLTDDEFAIMKSHTTIGHEILRGGTCPVLQLAARVALSHHERWDGNGYPQKLAGSEIPIEGRIVSVADVFDALTHKRPYKEAWSAADAIAEICRSAGSHFDPAVVDAFSGLDVCAIDFMTQQAA